MGVDDFWKRVPPESIIDRTAEELIAMVPYWFDDQFRAESAQGIVLGTEDTGALVDELLRLGAGDGPMAADHKRPIDPPDGDDDYYVGTFNPQHVQEIAEFLSRAPLQQWADLYRSELAAYAADLQYRRPFDDEWFAAVLNDAQALAQLFGTAAANNEAVIYRCVA